MSTRDDFDPDGLRLPIKIDTTSNGEFLPIPLSKANRLGNRTALIRATTNARRLARSRRDFLTSACGALTNHTRRACDNSRRAIALGGRW